MLHYYIEPSSTPLEGEKETKAVTNDNVESEINQISSSAYAQRLSDINSTNLEQENSHPAQESSQPYPAPIISYYSAKMFTTEDTWQNVYLPMINGMDCYKSPPVGFMNFKVEIGPDNDICLLEGNYVRVALLNSKDFYDEEVWAPIPREFPIHPKIKVLFPFFQHPSTQQGAVSQEGLDSLQKELDQVKVQLGIGQSN